MFVFFPLLQKKRGFLEPPLEGFESSTAASHGDVCDLDDSVHATRGMAANTNTGFYKSISVAKHYTHTPNPSTQALASGVLKKCTSYLCSPLVGNLTPAK